MQLFLIDSLVYSNFKVFWKEANNRRDVSGHNVDEICRLVDDGDIACISVNKCSSLTSRISEDVQQE